jgi:hypothetical protein
VTIASQGPDVHERRRGIGDGSGDIPRRHGHLHDVPERAKPVGEVVEIDGDTTIGCVSRRHQDHAERLVAIHLSKRDRISAIEVRADADHEAVLTSTRPPSLRRRITSAAMSDNPTASALAR